MVDTALKARILARVESTPSLTRSQAWRRKLGLSALALLASATLLLLSALPALGGAGWTGPRWASALALPPVLLALQQAWARGASMRARSSLRYGLAVLATPYVLMGLSLLGEGGSEVAPPGPRGLLRCAVALFLAGLLPLFAVAWLRRDAEPERAGAMGAALGVALGAAAWVVHSTACSSAEPLSLLFGHVLPLLLLGATGEVLGARWMTLRSEHGSWEPSPPAPRPRWNRSPPPPA